MTERKKDLAAVGMLLGLMIALFSKILFTSKIIRAPDIINEFYWGVVETKRMSLGELLDFGQVKAAWDIYLNSGFTSEGAYAAVHLLVHQKLFFFFMPAPASVAWLIVLNLFLGGVGLFYYCRAIGTSRKAALLAGLIFAMAPENASLINAGHVMKITTIVLAPWAFYFFELAFQKRRLIFFLSTGLVLAVQFYNSHWQIAYYTCLGIAVYGVIRLLYIAFRKEAPEKWGFARIVAGCVIAALFFFSSVAISLIPITQWSKDTNRGVQSGSNQGKGGLAREEAMMWSLPPEELGAFVIPGLFGLSRQEGGENPTNIRSYYWGRMVFTQTVSYMGLLPWLLVPLPLIFRRDRYTWLASAAIAGSLLFAMGQYTPFYNFLYDHFPGVNRFRVPKMIMFITVMGLGVMAARGLDLLLDSEVRARKGFKLYLAGVIALPLVLLVMLGSQIAVPSQWLGMLNNVISQPNRYEQGPQLIAQRWDNLVLETGIAAGFASLLALVAVAFARSWIGARTMVFLLFALFLADVGRINDKFTFLIKVPKQTRGERSPIIDFLSQMPKEYRVLPMDGTDPMQYVTNKIPVFFTSNAVQQSRWQEFLDSFVLNSAMPDILNVKYLIQTPAEYQEQRGSLGNRFEPVYTSPDGGHIVLENRFVLPKAWLVTSVVQINDPGQQLGMMQSPGFDPRRMALIESAPPLPLPSPAEAPYPVPGGVKIVRYEGENIVLDVSTQVNAVLVMGDKYYRAWTATDNGKKIDIYPVNHVLRGVYLTPGNHRIEYEFSPWSFRLGSSLTYASFALFAAVLGWEWRRKRKGHGQE
jgi:hypothetical protein